MKKFFKKIRYFLEYVLFLLCARALNLVSLDKASAICYFCIKTYSNISNANAIAKKNIRRVYPKIEKNQENKILDAMFKNFGRFIAEICRPRIWDNIEERIEILGLDNVEHFIRNRRPFIIFAGHFANWELMLNAACKLYPDISLIYRKLNNPWFNAHIKKMRVMQSVSLIPKGQAGSRGIIRAMKKKDTFVMLVDQKMNEGISVPLFGYPSMTSKSIATLALKYGYPLVPVQMIRKGDTSYFQVAVHSPLEISAGNDEHAVMLKINQQIENWVKEHPGQWLWFHRRWDKGFYRN